MHEKSYRSFLKAVSWRITGTLDTVLISFIILGDLKIAASIGLVEVFTKMTLYYFHERLWNKVKLGKTKHNPEYDI